MEYGFIADEIEKLIKAGVSQDEIAVISYKTKYFMPLLPYLKTKSNINIAYEKRDNLLEDEKITRITIYSPDAASPVCKERVYFCSFIL